MKPLAEIEAKSHRSLWHLAWALPLALAVIFGCAIVGLLRWCGDGAAETCSDPVRTAELFGDAVRWIVGGALVGGAIIALAPWTRVRWRILAGTAVAILVVSGGLLYLAA